MNQLSVVLGAILCVASTCLAMGESSATKKVCCYAGPQSGDPTAADLTAYTKAFLVAMRRAVENPEKHAIRRYIDPDYCERHEIAQDQLQLALAPVWAIHNIEIANDSRTAICTYRTQAGDEQWMILRWRVAKDEGVYVSPGADPDEQTRKITPWIYLKTK